MAQIVLIGLGAGAASALLFAAVASGSWLSVFLFYVSPLPIMIAALGWSHLAGLIAAISAAVVLTAIFGWVFLVAFLAGTGLPAWWLSYLAMLARPATAGAQVGALGQLEWYPPGRLVLWAAAFASVVVIAGILSLGTDFEGFRSGFREALERMVRVNPPPGAPAGRDTSGSILDFLVIAIPPAAAVLATITTVLNLWLAGKVVRFSGRLARPWPDLAAIDFPRPTGIIFLVAAVLTFVGGLVGYFATIASAALIVAYGMLGLAVLHAVTRGIKHRGLAIGATYVAILVFGWPVLGLCLLGIADQLFNLRGRVAQRRGPPTII
jgi:hypothetical protein